MLFSYTKSLMAGGMALLAVIFAVFWFQNRTIVLNKLLQTGSNLKTRITDGQTYAVAIADYAKRLVALRADTKKISSKFVGQDCTTSMLMNSIVEAASRSGMEMTNTSKHDKKTKIISTKGKELAIEVLSYRITLEGSYTALVKFLQNIASWNIGYTIESLEVASVNEGGTGDEVEVSFVLSVFALDQPTETKP